MTDLWTPSKTRGTIIKKQVNEKRRSARKCFDVRLPEVMAEEAAKNPPAPHETLERFFGAGSLARLIRHDAIHLSAISPQRPRVNIVA